MEQRGTTVTSLARLDDLRELASRSGMVLTDYTAFGPAGEAQPGEVGLRWKDRRRTLTGDRRTLTGGDAVPERALGVVADAIEGAGRGTQGLAVIVSPDGEPLVERLASAPPEGASWAPVPALRPLIARRQRHVPHVVALVDRTGADLMAWTAAATGPDPGTGTRADEVDSVRGEDDVVRKVKPGGWSQRRFQQRAEDSWHHNMSQVAGELAALADRIGAPLVAVGGDERAVGLLLDALPASVRERVVRIDVTRAPDGSEDRLGAEVAAELDRWAAHRLDVALAQHAEELGQGDRGAAGAGRTLEALRAVRVAQLLVVERGPAEVEGRRAWVEDRRDQVATTPGDLADPDHAVDAPLLDAAVAAALAGGADVLVVPAGEDGSPPDQLRDGLGALLRW
jgi:hypothetical protein